MLLFMMIIYLAHAIRLGGDLDAHGCKASAGFFWCEAEKVCARAIHCLNRTLSNYPPDSRGTF